MTESRPGAGVPADWSVHREATGYCLEARGDFDRASAEALVLEIQRLGKRSGVMIKSRVERVVDPDRERST